MAAIPLRIFLDSSILVLIPDIEYKLLNAGILVFMNLIKYKSYNASTQIDSITNVNAIQSPKQYSNISIIDAPTRASSNAMDYKPDNPESCSNFSVSETIDQEYMDNNTSKRDSIEFSETTKCFSDKGKDYQAITLDKYNDEKFCTTVEDLWQVITEKAYPFLKPFEDRLEIIIRGCKLLKDTPIKYIDPNEQLKICDLSYFCAGKNYLNSDFTKQDFPAKKVMMDGVVWKMECGWEARLKNHKKFYSLSDYGYTEALKLAQEWRKLQDDLLKKDYIVQNADCNYSASGIKSPDNTSDKVNKSDKSTLQVRGVALCKGSWKARWRDAEGRQRMRTFGPTLADKEAAERFILAERITVQKEKRLRLNSQKSKRSSNTKFSKSASDDDYDF